INSLDEINRMGKHPKSYNVRNHKTPKAVSKTKQIFFEMFCAADSKKEYDFIKDCMKIVKV
ncbi:unnamed protein product, partial [marine sediment metagenome]